MAGECYTGIGACLQEYWGIGRGGWGTRLRGWTKSLSVNYESVAPAVTWESNPDCMSSKHRLKRLVARLAKRA
jgi:hypothetical protein